jgi:hypothetical protein
MNNLPDLLTGPGFSCGPDGCVRLISVEATSQRGQAFLVGYYRATGEQAGGMFCDDEPEFLSFLPEEFKQLRRQASLAALSIGELSLKTTRTTTLLPNRGGERPVAPLLCLLSPSATTTLLATAYARGGAHGRRLD